MEPQGRSDRKVRKARKARKEIKATMVIRVILDQEDPLDQEGYKEFRENPGLKGPKEIKVILEQCKIKRSR